MLLQDLNLANFAYYLESFYVVDGCCGAVL